MNRQENAKHALQHYFRMCAKASGLKWDSDNDAEVAGIVDDLLEAARDEAEERFVAKPYER